MRDVTDEELWSSGPSLRTSENLEVEQLTLGEGFDYTWAMEQLSAYGPTGQQNSWDEDFISRFGIPDEIRNENNVTKFLEEGFLGRVMCAGFFLFATATNVSPTPCPTKESTKIKDESTSGPSGRPDRQLIRHGKNHCLVEIKTKKVCRSGAGNLIHVLREAPVLHGDLKENFIRLESGKKKSTSLLYQVSQFMKGNLGITNRSLISRYGISS